MNLLEQRGYKCVVWNAAIAAIPDHHFTRYVTLYRRMKEGSDRGTCLFGIHEYPAFFHANGVGHFSDEDLFNHAKIQPKNWPRNLKCERVYNPVTKTRDLPPYWHILRH
jgi:hypothetical protein